jgi:hypothetical protein
MNAYRVEKRLEKSSHCIQYEAVTIEPNGDVSIAGSSPFGGHVTSSRRVCRAAKIQDRPWLVVLSEHAGRRDEALVAGHPTNRSCFSDPVGRLRSGQDPEDSGSWANGVGKAVDCLAS